MVGSGRIGRWKTAQCVRRSGHDRPGDGLGADWQRQGAIWRTRGAGTRCAHGAWRSKGWMGRWWPRLIGDDSVVGLVPVAHSPAAEGLVKSLVIANPTTLEIPSDGGAQQPTNGNILCFAYLCCHTTGNPHKCIIPASKSHSSHTC